MQNFVTRGSSIDDATERVQAWGDAVAFYGDGSQEQFENVTDALAKMQTKGTVGMDQLNRLFDAGIDAVGIYAKATGKSADDVQSALSKGEISAEDFIDTVSTAMMEGTNGVINISGAAKEAGATWGSTVANMKTAVARGVANIITSIDNMLTSNGLPDMRQMIADFGKKFEEVLSAAANNIPTFVSSILNVYDTIKPWLPLLASVSAGLLTAYTAFKAFAKVKLIIDAIKVSMLALNTTMLANPIFWVVAAIVAAVALIYIYWEPISEFFISLWGVIKEAGLAVWDYLKDAWSSSVEFLKSTWKSISTFFTELWNGIKEVFVSAWEGIKEVFNTVLSAILVVVMGYWDSMSEGIFNVWDGIASYFKNLWELIKNIFVGAFLILVLLVTGQWEEMGNVTRQVWDNIKGAIEGIWDSIKQIFNGAFQAITGFTKKHWDNIMTVFGAAFKWLDDKTNGAFTVIAKVIDTLMTTTWEIIKSVWSYIKDTFSNVLKFLKALVKGDFRRHEECH